MAFGIDDLAFAYLGSSLLNSASNVWLQQNANQANKDLWREQSEYNKPINQLARLREAGLNPNLIYGSGGVQNTITSAPKMDAPTVDLNFLSAYQQVLNGRAQRELIKEQVNLTKAQENNAQLKSVGQILDNVYKGLENEYKSYENKKYMENGLVKGDTPLIRAGGRIWDFISRATGLFSSPAVREAGSSDLERLGRSWTSRSYNSKYGGGLK